MHLVDESLHTGAPCSCRACQCRSFVAGVIIPKANNSDFTEHLAERMELVVMEVFMPLYFAASGIRTNIGTLNTARYW